MEANLISQPRSHGGEPHLHARHHLHHLHAGANISSSSTGDSSTSNPNSRSLVIHINNLQECFHEKDFLNHRYHAKRGLYLCIIKKYLKLSPLIQNVEWSSFQNEARKPILVVRSAIKIAEVPDLVVRIIPTATSLFNISKLKLMRNNIRAMKQGEETDPQATPKYNCSILEDMFLEDQTELIKRTFLGWKALGEALILLKVDHLKMWIFECRDPSYKAFKLGF